MISVTAEAIGLWQADVLRVPGVVHGVSTRSGGTSRNPFDSLNLAFHTGDDAESVRLNRSRLSTACDGQVEDWVCCDQVHGTRVETVTRSERGSGATKLETSLPQTDGMVTEEPGLTLVTFYADCVPLLLVDPDGPRIGLAHAGWKGTLGRIGAETVAAMQREFGSKPTRIRAAIGPSIGPCCYEISDGLMLDFRSQLGSLVSVKQRPGGPHLDLWKTNENILRAAGIPPENIEQAGLCTACRNDLFFSHRKEGPATGRMAAFMRILDL